MKDLLLKIQTELRKIQNMRDTDIFLSPDLDVIPEGARTPCIGIKDGDVVRHYLSGDVVELDLPVQIGVYDRLVRNDLSIISVFNTTTAVLGALSYNYLDGYVKEVEPGRETAVQLMVRQGDMLLRKIISFQYFREE